MHFKEKRNNPISVINKAKGEWIEYKELCYNKEVKSPQQDPGRNLEQGWLPPPNGFLMVNTDAAWKKEKSKTGMGMMVRDNKGKLISAWAKAIENCGSAAMYLNLVEVRIDDLDELYDLQLNMSETRGSDAKVS